MNDKFKEIFGQIQAEDELKNRTRLFLAGKTRGYARAGTEKRRRPVYAAYAAACLLCVLLGGRWLYFTPIAEISIDINPSIELRVNRFDQVISVDGLNGDGQALAQGLDVKYRTYTAAIERILHHDRIAALLSNDEVMAITVSGSDELRSARILSEVEARTAEHRNTYCYVAPPEDAAAAHELGLSCGKYRAFLELRRLDPDITPEAVGEMTMREIWELAGRLSPDGGNGLPPYGSQENGHHGHHGRGGNANKRRRRMPSPALALYSSSSAEDSGGFPPIFISCHFSLVMRSCRGLEPSKGPTYPRSSSWSTRRAARE